MRICSIDVGTTGTKVIIFDENGREMTAEFSEYPVICVKDGWAEQDAEEVFRTAVYLLKRCLEKSEFVQLEAIVLSVQGDAVIPVDKNGNALMHAILGMDNRSVPQAKWCENVFGALPLFYKTGMRPQAVNSATKIRWILEERPDIAERTGKFLTYEGYILKCLGADDYITDRTMASRSMMCGFDTDMWQDDILAALDIKKSLLPMIVSSGTIVGRLGRKLTEELNLKESPCLITGGHDQTCAGIGAGAIYTGIAVDSHGTAEVLSTSFKERPDMKKMCAASYPCYSHAVPGMKFTFALNHSGGISFRWFRDKLGEVEVRKALETGKKAYDILVEGMGDTPTELLFLPHLNGSGTPNNDHFVKGCVAGLTLTSTKEEVGRALLEGLAYEMRLNLEGFIENGIPVTDIRSVGGGASHPKILQLKADVLGQPVSVMKNREAASLGAAIIALSGLKYFDSVAEGVDQLVRVKETYYPSTEYAGVYTEKFRLYNQIYKALLPIYKDWR